MNYLETGFGVRISLFRPYATRIREPFTRPVLRRNRHGQLSFLSHPYLSENRCHWPSQTSATLPYPPSGIRAC